MMRRQPIVSPARRAAALGTAIGAMLMSILIGVTAVRLSGTRTDDIGDLTVQTYGIDLMLSKRLALATPYVGIGSVRIESKAGGTGLAEESFTKGRLFGGLNINLAVINLAFEAERLGDNTTLSAKAGWRF